LTELKICLQYPHNQGWVEGPIALAGRQTACNLKAHAGKLLGGEIQENIRCAFFIPQGEEMLFTVKERGDKSING